MRTRSTRWGFFLRRFRLALLDDFLCRVNVTGFDSFDGGGKLSFGNVANFLDDVFGGGNSAGADSIFKSSGYGFCGIKAIREHSCT